MPKRSSRTARVALEETLQDRGSPSHPTATGRMLVVMERGQVKSACKSLENTAGLSVAASSDFAAGASGSNQADVLLETLGIAVVTPDPNQGARLMSAAADEGNPSILAVEPELICYALGSVPVDLEYLRGWRDATAYLYDRLSQGQAAAQEARVTRRVAVHLGATRMRDRYYCVQWPGHQGGGARHRIRSSTPRFCRSHR